MSITQELTTAVKKAVQQEFEVTLENVEIQPTRKDFEGDLTVVVFPMLRDIKMNPVQLGERIGDSLVKELAPVEKFNVVKGFLNIVFSDAYYLEQFNEIRAIENFGKQAVTDNSRRIMVEYSSPNTNKPLHLGHIRNNLLGASVAKILSFAGNEVFKTQIINDRGIHICKSMLAWKKFGQGETPQSSGKKGDHLVGEYYVKFDKAYKAEIENLKKDGQTQEEADKNATLLQEAQEMLQKWEAGDDKTVDLWKTMNGWVEAGFEKTYKALGVSFDKNYYESNTYLLGKKAVDAGLEKGVFYTKDDGSVWIDLTDDGLDEKLVLRADGTAVYMTQDLGTAIQRVEDFNIDGMVYTVGNEQDYHFKVLFLILKKLGYKWADYLYHLSYGMVDLPTGKMKSREGTVVDADDLIVEMQETAAKISQENGKLDGYTPEEKEELHHIIGMGALKYFILKVDPRKKMVFDPEQSVDFQGDTGPFIQYTFARIQSILRKVDFEASEAMTSYDLHPPEKELIKQLLRYPETVQQAADQHSPAVIANYTYDLVKGFNSFYQNISILKAESEEAKIFRIQLAESVGKTVKSAFGMLGISVPERM